ncbi:TlpA family protein disulfide reductase [Telluribacter humicola]|uniref:TlpA family protein disulfide reductase n=1 Tax=Telluribacter humicola TaxID=1720261 RepID=UPI001A976427|nr:TlpA disulfide reductase family protein [Telluribacter humicola]
MVTDGLTASGVYHLKDQEVSVLTIFMDSARNIDNKTGKGYWVLLRNEGNAVPLAHASIAEFYAGAWSPETYHLVAQKKQAKELFEKEFELYPHLKSKYIRHYLKTLDLNDSHEKSIFIRELDFYANLPTLTEWDYLTGISNFYHLLGEEELSRHYKSEVFRRFPKGSWALQTESLQSLKDAYLTNDFQKIYDIYLDFKKTYVPRIPDEWTRRVLTNRGVQLLTKVAEAYKGPEMPTFWQNEVDSLPAEYRKYAYTTSARLVLRSTSRNLALGELLSRRSVEEHRLRLHDPRIPIERPYLTDSMVQSRRNVDLAEAIEQHAKYLTLLKRHSEALPLLREAAITLTKGSKAAINHSYIQCLIELGMVAKARQEIEAILKRNGKIDPDFIAKYDQVFKSKNSLSDVEHQLREERRITIQNEFINVPFPRDLSLQDYRGNAIALGDLTGKILVIDFWASWCAPCIAGLPGMSDLAKRYKEESDVLFLFVNTSDSNRPKALQLFRRMPQHTLYFDNFSSVASSLDVTGLPTKLVVDKGFNIQYRKIGISSDLNDDVRELSDVIEILKSR